jgi:hypothetical protein
LKKIGFIQTRGIGDIIIALPIAHYFHKMGYKVLWPIDSKFVPFMAFAAPYVSFLPVDYHSLSLSGPEEYFVNAPLKLLKKAGCSDIRLLYNALGGKLTDPHLGISLKFDEYKYAVCKVPFQEKWNLHIERNMDREMLLYKSLGIIEEYVCIHRQDSNIISGVSMIETWQKRYRVIEVSEKTDNPLDWIYTLENANKLMLLDSCFANLVEQLNWQTEKYLILRSKAQVTPVFKNGWTFI